VGKGTRAPSARVSARDENAAGAKPNTACPGFNATSGPTASTTARAFHAERRAGETVRSVHPRGASPCAHIRSRKFSPAAPDREADLAPGRDWACRLPATSQGCRSGPAARWRAGLRRGSTVPAARPKGQGCGGPPAVSITSGASPASFRGQSSCRHIDGQVEVEADPARLQLRHLVREHAAKAGNGRRPRRIASAHQHETRRATLRGLGEPGRRSERCRGIRTGVSQGDEPRRPRMSCGDRQGIEHVLRDLMALGSQALPAAPMDKAELDASVHIRMRRPVAGVATITEGGSRCDQQRGHGAAVRRSASGVSKPAWDSAASQVFASGSVPSPTFPPIRALAAREIPDAARRRARPAAAVRPAHRPDAGRRRAASQHDPAPRWRGR
jgi:hypothetical protein